MKKLFRRLLCCLMTASLLISFALPSVADGEAGDGGQDDTEIDKKPKISIDFGSPPALMNAGDSERIVAVINTENFSKTPKYTYRWTTDSSNVIDVIPTTDKDFPTADLKAAAAFDFETDKPVKITLYVNDTANGISGSESFTVTAKAPVPIVSFKITKPESTIIRVGSETLTLEAIPRDKDNNPIRGSSVKWSSNYPRIASVNETSGVVTAKSKGTATITAECRGKTDSIEITVDEAFSVSLVDPPDGNTISLKPTQDYPEELEVRILPERLSSLPVKWNSSDSKVAIVTPVNGNDKKATIKAGSTPGTAVITATVRDDTTGEETSAKCQVVVDARDLYLRGIEITETQAEIDKKPLTVGTNEQMSLTANLIYQEKEDTGDAYTGKDIKRTPDDKVHTVKWTSSDTSIAEVWSNGTVRAKSGGTVTITVTSGENIADGFTEMEGGSAGGPASASRTITVNQSSKRLQLSNTSRRLEITETPGQETKYDSFDLTVTHNPPTAYPKMEFTWENSNKDVVEMIEDSKDKSKVTIKAKGVGEAVITVTGRFPNDNTTEPEKVTCTVTVTKPITKIELNPTKVTNIKKGEKQTLTATLYPVGAKDTVTWLTSDNRYVRVNSTGDTTAEITAVEYTDKPVTITAKVGQPPHAYSATCEVNVTKTGVGKVTLVGLGETTPKTASISLGSSLQLSAAIKPETATETDLIWTSSDENYATVSRTGKVTPQRKTEAGKPVIITVSSKNNPDAKDTVAVTVTAHKVTGVRLEPADPVTLDKVGDTQRFVGSLVPSTADDTLRWGVKGGQTDSSTIAKNDIISLKSGGSNKVVIVTGLAPGETDVMVNVGDFTTSTTVTVSGIKFEKDSLSVAVGKSAPVVKQLFGRAKNLNALDWEWKSDNDAVARVNPSTGLVSGIKPGTAKISCKNGIYSAEISVTVSESSATVLSYKMGDDKRYSFGEKILSDIRNQCKTAFEDSDLNYVTNLSVPPSQGTLYYGYVSETNPGEGVAASDKFYYKTSATASARPADDYRYTTGKPSDKLLADVTFIPATGFSGKADISYTAVAENGKDLAGSIEITVPATTELRYDSPNGEAIRFHSNDFTTLSQASSGYPISSVRFNAPSERYGYLYYEYSGGDVYGSNITSGQRFYASSTPSLDSVAFVPRSGYNGTFPLTFTGWNTNGSSFTGTIRITVKSTSEGGGDITYSTLSGSRVYFDTSDFQALCRTATGGKLNYIQFTSLPSTDDASSSSSSSSSAVLYHGSGSGSGNRVGTSSSIYATSSGSRWTIDDVYLLPSSTYTGSVTIPFKGWDTNRKTFEGTVVVNVTKDGGTAATIYMTCTGMPLVFRRADFDDACKDALPATLKSVRFSLPQDNSGTLYERFNDLNDRKALAEGTDIPAADLVTLSYLPKGESSGTVYISYTATDEKGNVCDGQVRITSDPNPVSLYFVDMNDTVWAIPSVNFLRSYGVVTGKGKKRYQPNATLKRGDFVLMLARAFGFQLNGSESFPDVPKDSYYAGAIAAAKSMSLVKGSGKNGSFRPEEEITRQEAATILYRVLQREQNLSAAETGYLANYSDSGQIETYALTAFATLVRDGIFEGSSGRIYPYAPLTRAQMAVILHRAIT